MADPEPAPGGGRMIPNDRESGRERPHPVQSQSRERFHSYFSKASQEPDALILSQRMYDLLWLNRTSPPSHINLQSRGG